MNLLHTSACKQLLLTAFTVFSLIASLGAQNQRPAWHFLDAASIPAPSAEMPDYIRPLYDDAVDFDAVLAAHKAHYAASGIREWREDLERDPYAKFFFHWVQEAEDYLGEDGMVRQLSTEDLLSFRAKAHLLEKAGLNNPIQKSSNAWSFVGPRRTVWRAEHRPNQQIAPWQVNIYSMAVSLSNPSRVVCGSETGEVYFTDDKGVNWTPVRDYNFGRAIISVAIHPTNEDEVYVGTSTDVLRTTDAGLTWTPVLTGSSISPNTLRFNSDGTVILAGNSNGVMRSTNNGGSWTNTLSEEVMDIAFQPGNDNVVYALVRESGPNQCMFYKSLDGGLTFALSMAGWTPYADASGGRMDVTNADSDYIYIGLLTASNTPVILRSTNAAGGWTEVAQGNTTALNMDNGQGYYDLDIVANDLNAQEVIFATNTSYRSSDGGVNYTALGGYRGPFDVHPDMQEMVSVGGDTWITTDGGMNYSTDFYADVANWEPRIDGLDGTNFWGYDHGWNEDYMIGGRYHNGNTALHENYPAQFALRMGGAESPTGHAWHGKERYSIFNDISNTILPYNFTDEAEGTFSFTKQSPNDYFYGSTFSNLLIDREDYETLYIGEGRDLWRSKDGGIAWESLHNFDNEVWAFDISRANPDVFYLVADNGIHKSSDRGETFSQISTPPGVPTNRIWSMRIAVSGTDANELWLMDEHAAGSSGSRNRPRVWYSSNGGSSWTSWHTTALEGRQYRAFTHHIGSNGGVYLVSNRSNTPGVFPAKVFYRDKSMSEWLDCSAGFPASSSAQKILPYHRGNVLRWAGNRGIWEMPLVQQNWAPIVQPFMNGREVLCAGDVVEFDSYSVATANTTYSWSIPGAATTTALNQREVSATFSTPGSYTATLTINQNGAAGSKALTFEVGDNCNPDPLPGNSVSMSGSSDDFVVMDAPLGITTNSLTMSAWIKPEGSQVGTACVLFMRGSTSVGLNYYQTSGRLSIHWNGGQWWWDSGQMPTPGEWNHVAMTVEPGRVIIYLNGVPSVRNFTVDPVSFDSPIAFGRDLTRGDRNFSGELDEVVLYNRTLSQDEIRELMHLTRVPDEETGVLAYYQFNHDDGPITNRAGGTHAKLAGGAVRTTSTAPVGPGTSARLDVNAAGSYAFGDTDLTLDFAAGTVPNGELCVTRLDIQPDQLPIASGAIDKYWVVHNYGNNSFTELGKLTFDKVGPVDGAYATSPETVSLYKRNSTAHGNTWGGAVAAATEVTTGADGTVVFGAGNGQTSFSQFTVNFNEIVLGAELNQFTAEVQNQKAVDLNWVSAREENLDRYDIERSADGQVFTTIGDVAGGGDTEVESRYAFLDETPLRGRSYYRLRMVDFDGTITFSEVRSVLLRAIAERVVVYPNPLQAGQGLQVVLQDDQEYTFDVFSSTGERVGTYRVSGETTLSLPDLPAGLYGWQLVGRDYRTQGVFVRQ